MSDIVNSLNLQPLTYKPMLSVERNFLEKKGYTIALRTGPSMPECERVIGSIEHFYGHLEIESCDKLGLCSVEYKEDAAARIDEITDFCNMILES